MPLDKNHANWYDSHPFGVNHAPQQDLIQCRIEISYQYHHLLRREAEIQVFASIKCQSSKEQVPKGPFDTLLD